MNKRNEIHVNIGEVKLGKSGDILKATLGSCLGLAFLWREQNLFGLAHCLLPQREGTSFEITAKYVSQAIPSLIALMKIKEEDRPKIEVVLAGGGNLMFQLMQQNTNQIGLQNIETAKNVLKAQGFRIKREDVGGQEGRQIFIDCTSGEVEIVKLQEIKR